MVTPNRRLDDRRSPWLSRRRRGERGAALVESAIVILPLCLIVFGIIEFGFIFKDSLTLSSASRAGARTASALPNQTQFLTLTRDATAQAATATSFAPGDTMRIYKSNPSGAPSGSCPGSTCAVYTWNGSSWGGASGDWDHNTHQACLGGAIDSVGVEVNLTHDSITGFFPFVEGMTLTERTVMRLEPLESDCGP